MSVLLVDSAALEQSVIPDGLRLVRFVAPHFEAARPVPLVDLTTGERKLSEGGGVSLAPAERDRGNIRLDVPWAGEVPSLDRHGNARLSFTLRLLAGDPVADADWVVGQIIAAPGRSAIEWRRGGRPTYYPLRGDADWTPTYRMRERQQGAGMLVAFSVEVAPYAHRGSMDVVDDFAVDSLAEYTFDEGAGTLSVASGQLVPADTVEKRAVHTGRGFRYADAQGTVMVTTGPTVAGGVVGVVLRHQDASNLLVGQLTATALEIWKMDGGIWTQLATVASTGLAASSTRWVRFRAEGNSLILEVFAAQPSPMLAPGQTITHTLAGADVTKFGAAVSGAAGFRLTPAATDWRLDDFVVMPYTYRARTFPRALALGGRIPGDLPALCDLVVTPSGGTAAPVAGLVGWSTRPSAATWGRAPLGVIEAESGTILTGFVAASSAAALGGQFLHATAAGPSSAAARWEIDSGLLPPDEDGTVSVEVFARIGYDQSYTGLKWVLWADPGSGTNYGARRYSDRGSAGLSPPAASASVRRFVRLGRIRLGGQQMLGLEVSWTAGSNDIVLDYLVAVPSRSLVASPMGVALDAAFPRFVASTAETVRTLLADGGGLIAEPTTMHTPLREHGLGRRIELPIGDTDLVAKLSSLVVDRPEADAATEQLTHTATLHAAVLPRFSYA